MAADRSERRAAFLRSIVRSARERAAVGQGARHDAVLALTIELECLARCPDLTAAELAALDVPGIVREVAGELGLLDEGRTDEVERLIADGRRYAADKDPVRLPGELCGAEACSAPAAAPAPEPEPTWTGTLWRPHNGQPAIRCPGDGEQWQMTPEQMAAAIAHPRPQLAEVDKADLPLICLATFRDRSEAEARAEHSKKLEAYRQELERWEQRPSERRGKRPKPPAEPRRPYLWGEHYRHGSTLLQVHGVGLDLDNPAEVTSALLRQAFGRVGFMAHTTYSHRLDAPAWRIFLLLRGPVGRAEAARLVKEWAAPIVAEHFRPGTRQTNKGALKPVLDVRPPEQGWFVPCPRPGYEYLIHSGPPLDAAAVLRELDAQPRPEPEQAAQERQGAPHVVAPSLTCGASLLLYQRTDLGNAERLLAYAGDLMWICEAWGRLTWTGQRWALDETGQVERWMQETVRLLPQQAVDALRAKQIDSDEYSDWLEFAASSERAGRLASGIKLAEPHRKKPASAFDANPWLLNLPNCTMDLRTGEARPHAREDLLTRIAGAGYDPTAACSRWEAFLAEVLPDPEVRAFVQRAVGYSLTGLTDEQVFFLLHGRGANGKGVFCETIGSLLGKNGEGYATSADFSTFLVDAKARGGEPRPDLVKLVGARFVWAGEPDDGARFSDSMIKKLTGEDTLTVRQLRREPFDFLPTFKIWLACNNKPHVRDTSDGFWRRVRFIPFTVQIPPEHRDAKLKEKLRGELSGILRWALEGLRQWRERGLGSAAAVEQAGVSYREEEDPLARWVRECCVVMPGASATAAELRRSLERWCEAEGSNVPSPKRLGMRLKDLRCSSRKYNGNMVWSGIGLLADGEDREDGEATSRRSRESFSTGRQPEVASPSSPSSPEQGSLSLPPRPGGNGNGKPQAAELPPASPSVAALVAEGWTVGAPLEVAP